MGSVYTEESVGKLKEAEFYERFGIGSVFFGVLLDRLTECHEEQHSKGGRPNLLSVFQSLVVFLLYTRQYMTQTILADIMGVKKMGRVKSVPLGSGRLAGERLFSSCRKPENRKGNVCAF